MQKLNSFFKCPLCDNKTQISFRKPDHFSPSNVKVQCAYCASKFNVTAKHRKGETDKVDMTAVHIQGGQDATTRV